eukprot:6879103-Prymnesium_polylepis.1
MHTHGAAGMYARAYKTAAAEFTQLAKGEAVVEWRFLSEEPMQMLELSGQYVRLCPRLQRPAGSVPADCDSHDCVVDGADAMHAMLLNAHRRTGNARPSALFCR